MRSIKYFRAKDPVLSTLLALGMVVTLPLLAKAEIAGGWEEARPVTRVEQQLMTAPPTFTQGSTNVTVRPPVKLPQTADMLFRDETDEGLQIDIVADDSEESDVSADAYYGGGGGTYTIQRGDTLGKIAKNLLGSSQKWRDLAVANPHINPNKLSVGDTIAIPGAQPSYAQPSYSPPSQMVRSAPSMPEVPSRAASAVGAYKQAKSEPVIAVSAPSFDPPPLLAPPPSPSSYGYAPQVYSSQGAPVYSAPSAPMAPPVAPAPIPMPPPMYSSGAGQGADQSYFQNVNAAAGPVSVSTRDIYREERYRIPDELKPTDFMPYFNNMNGYYGLFEIETAFLPFIPTWDLGVHVRHRKYQYLMGKKNIIEGNELYAPMHLTYAYRKMFFGATVPYQNWEVKAAGGGAKTDLTGLHDYSFKFAYQVWKSFEGDHALTLHAETRFSGDNYHREFAGGGKSKEGAVMGPAYATRGSWMELGCAYSGQTNERWSNHFNLAIANNSRDDILKFKVGAGTDYRVNRNFSIVGELISTSYETDNPLVNGGESGTNVDLTLGFVLFNDQWQASLAFPMAIQKDWWYAHDYGVIFGVNTRWD
jgi:LysM repeat protein